MAYTLFSISLTSDTCFDVAVPNAHDEKSPGMLMLGWVDAARVGEALATSGSISDTLSIMADIVACIDVTK
jgi:hypothetical protein